MQATESAIKPGRKVSVRKRLARMNGLAVAWYIVLTAAGIVLYKAGAVYAMQERGYYAVGGEVLALFLPVFWYVGSRTISDLLNEFRPQNRRNSWRR